MPSKFHLKQLSVRDEVLCKVSSETVHGACEDSGCQRMVAMAASSDMFSLSMLWLRSTPGIVDLPAPALCAFMGTFRWTCESWISLGFNGLDPCLKTCEMSFLKKPVEPIPPVELPARSMRKSLQATWTESFGASYTAVSRGALCAIESAFRTLVPCQRYISFNLSFLKATSLNSRDHLLIKTTPILQLIAEMACLTYRPI